MKGRNEGFCNIVCMKTLFFVFNFIFWVRIGILAVGVWIMVFKSDYKSILDSDIYVIVPGLMIAAGVVVIIVAVVGCVGAVKENRFFLISFLVMVTLIFALELTIGVLAWVYSSKIKEEIQTTIKDKIDQQYGENSDVTKSIDKLQKENKCCGDTGGRSWNNTAWQRVQRSQGKNNIVPDSCCKTQTPDCGMFNPSGRVLSVSLHSTRNHWHWCCVYPGMAGVIFDTSVTNIFKTASDELTQYELYTLYRRNTKKNCLDFVLNQFCGFLRNFFSKTVQFTVVTRDRCQRYLILGS
ncbi:CD151 antigen [Acropora cervicornis]|uniref:CD151 antigen n=1 Tax=Acropora cervicornis TaxID=6130 RepID=A0AAD9QXK6_ACRCE|nr:CD151 antigen [Acropora cervicornis]